MRKLIIAAVLAAVAVPMTPALADRDDHRGRGHGWNDDRHGGKHYDKRYSKRGNYWKGDRYYRDGRYDGRRLARNDRVYRGNNGNYYCKRDDGTTGLIIGAAGGALLGRVIDTDGDRLLGTLLGGGAGALLGREIDRGDVRCR